MAIICTKNRKKNENPRKSDFRITVCSTFCGRTIVRFQNYLDSRIARFRIARSQDQKISGLCPVIAILQNCKIPGS